MIQKQVSFEHIWSRMADRAIRQRIKTDLEAHPTWADFDVYLQDHWMTYYEIADLMKATLATVKSHVLGHKDRYRTIPGRGRGHLTKVSRR